MTYGSRTHGQPVGGGLGRAEQPRGPLGRVGAGRLRRQLTGMPADREAEAGLGVVPLRRQAVRGQIAARLPGGGGHAARRGHRGLVDRVGVLGRLHPGHPRIGGQGGPLQFQCQRHLVLGRELSQLRAVKVQGRGRHTVGLGHARELVGAAEAGVVQRLLEGLAHGVVVEGRGVGEALPPVPHNPHADSLRRRRRERLDLALVGPHLGLALVGHEGFHVEASAGPTGDPLRDLQQARAHAAVPPGSVISSRLGLTRRCRPAR